MNDYSNLRKSIKTILEKEDLQYRNIQLSNSEINNILYQKRYTIGYTDYIGLNHFFEVVKVYSRLTGEFTEFVEKINLAITNIEQSIIKTFKEPKPANTDEETQDLALASSHNLKNNNIINESNSKTVDFVKELNSICQSSITVEQIVYINQQISADLGFFFESYLEKSINDYIEKNILKEEDFRFKDTETTTSERVKSIKVSLTYFKIYYEDRSLTLEDINLDFFVRECPNIKEEIYKCIKYMNNLLELSRKKKEGDSLFWSNTLDEKNKSAPRYDYSIYANDRNQNNIIINLDLKVRNEPPRYATSSSHLDVIDYFPNCHYFSIASFLKENNVFIDCTMKELILKFKYAIIDKHESIRDDRINSGYLAFTSTDYNNYDEDSGILEEINIDFYEEPTLKQLYFRPDFLSAEHCRKINKAFFDSVKDIFKEKVYEYGFDNLVKSFLTGRRTPDKQGQRKFLEQNENFAEVRGICVNVHKLNEILNNGIEISKNNFRLALSREKNSRGKKLGVKTTIVNILINFLKTGLSGENLRPSRYANIILKELLEVEGKNMTKFIKDTFDSQKLNSESLIRNYSDSIITENLLRKVIRSILEKKI